MKTAYIAIFSGATIAVMLFLFFVVYGILVYNSSKNDITSQERIYLHTDVFDKFGPSYFVKVSDMEPNSVGFFMYPSSYNYSDTANAYQRFMLIRLPSWLGGDKNDISSYRAYSMLDLDSHCLIKYWPQDQRQRIEDPCHFEMYRAIDGVSYFYGVKFMSKPVEDALPKLDLGADDQGYIYVKPPTWTTDKNGIAGDGRHMSKDEILRTSKLLLRYYQNATHNNIDIPLEIEDGKFFLVDVVYGKDVTFFRYSPNNATTNVPTIEISYCNCTALSDKTISYDYQPWNIQLWGIGDNTPLYYSYSPYDKADYAIFVFFKNGYRILYDTKQPFSDGMQTVLDEFFNGTSISQVQQSQVVYGNVENSNFTVSYAIDHATITSMKLDTQSTSLEILLQTTGDGTLVIDLPRALIDSKTVNMDNTFFVLADGQEISYKEVHKTIQDRTLSIPFKQGTEKI